MFIGMFFLLLLLMGLFSIPLSLKFAFDQNSTNENKIEVGWLFDLVQFRIPLQQETALSPKIKSNKPKEQESSRSKTIFKLLLQKRFRHRIFKYMSDIWHSISKENIMFHVRAGLGDPADTGMLWAIVGPTSLALPQVHQFSVLIEPDFINAGFEFDGHGKIQLIPLRIIVITMWLIFSPALWKVIRHIRAGNSP